MTYEFVFLCPIIPGPDHPRQKLNMILKPLIDELKEMSKGLKLMTLTRSRTSDSETYFFLVHDFVAYVIFVG
jgi:hypothetical protein